MKQQWWSREKLPATTTEEEVVETETPLDAASNEADKILQLVYFHDVFIEELDKAKRNITTAVRCREYKQGKRCFLATLIDVETRLCSKCRKYVALEQSIPLLEKRIAYDEDSYQDLDQQIITSTGTFGCSPMSDINYSAARSIYTQFLRATHEVITLRYAELPQQEQHDSFVYLLEQAQLCVDHIHAIEQREDDNRAFYVSEKQIDQAGQLASQAYLEQNDIQVNAIKMRALLNNPYSL